MAEKITIGSVEIDVGQAIKDAAKLAQEIEDLKKQQKALKKDTRTGTVEYQKLTAQLKGTQKEYNAQAGALAKVEQSQKQVVGSIARTRSELSVVSQQWAKNASLYGENSKQAQKLAAEKTRLTESLTQEEKATGDARRQVGFYEKAQAGAAKATEGVAAVSPKAAAGIKAVGAATKFAFGFIGLIVGALAAVVGALRSFFTSSEEGQNALRRFGAIFKTIFGNINDIASSVGEAIVNVFTKPREAIEGFKKRLNDIKDFFVNTFGNIIGGQIDLFVANFLKSFAAIGLAWQKLKGVFTDNAEGIQEQQDKITALNERQLAAQERTRKGAENLKDAVVDGYNAMKDSAQAFVDEQQREIAIAQNLADRQAALTKLRRQSEVQIAKNKDAIQELVLASRDETLSAEERRAAIERANKIQADQLRLKEQIARENLALIKSQNALSNSTIEDKQREATAEAELFNLRAENTSKLRELKNRMITLDNEIAKEQQERAKAEVENLQQELEMWQLTNESKLEGSQQLNQQLIAQEEQRLNTELQKQKEILQQQLDNELITEQEHQLALLELEKQKNESIKALTLEYEEQERERLQEKRALDAENEMALVEGDLFAELELKRKFLEQERQQEVEFAKSIGADVNKVNEKYNKADLALERTKTDAKLSLAGGFAQDLATIFGEQTAIGKAAAVAQTTIATIQSGVNSYNSMAALGLPAGPVLGAVAAAAAVASGYAQIKKILSVKSGLPGEGGGGGASVPSAGGAAPKVPNVQRDTGTTTGSVGAGIVSRDTADNSSRAVAEGVGQALQENPLQPTLVEDDVTVKQTQSQRSNQTSVI